MTPRIKALHSQTAVVSIIVKVNKGEDPKKTFTDKMGEALVFLREAGLDKDVAILHIDHLGGVLSSKRRIQKKLDVPKYIMDMRRFFYINAVNQPSGRSIKCSALMYFTSNPKKLLAEAGANLKNLGVGIYHRELQEVETVSEHVLLGAQMSIRVEDVEIEFRVCKATQGNQERRELQGPWDLPIAITKDFAPGMPWESDKDKSRGSGPRTSLPCPGLVPLTGSITVP